MASREKKTQSIKKPNTPSPQPPKDDGANNAIDTNDATNDDTLKASAEDIPNIIGTKTISTPKSTPLVKRLAKKSRQLKKKTNVTIKLKSKVKKKIERRKLIKTILKTTTTKSDNKKKLLKNGVKQVKPRQRRMTNKSQKESNIKQEEDLDLPPVLEPIYALDANVVESPTTRRKTMRTTPRKQKKTEIIVKENVEQTNRPKRMTKRRKKDLLKDEELSTPTTASENNETLEQVIEDLSSLIKSGDIKQESEAPSEITKSDDVVKAKRIIKRKRKENNIETTLEEFGPAERKVIDMLDLNVEKIKNGSQSLITTKRRYSIEKIQISTTDDVDSNSKSAATTTTTTTTQNVDETLIFNNLPRSLSPRQRTTKLRQSVVDGHRNPYKTRSDSLSRILRNGKHRKLKVFKLLDGLDSIPRKRKKQCCGDCSESDSSFSDLSSTHGGIDNQETKDLEVVKTEKDVEEILAETLPEDEGGPESSPSPSLLNMKMSLISDHNISNVTDTNLNCIDDINRNKEKSPSLAIKNEDNEDLGTISPSSLKVPEKDLILVSMKQIFNDSYSDDERKNQTNGNCETITTSKFYGESKLESPSPPTTTTTTIENSCENKVVDELLNESHIENCCDINDNKNTNHDQEIKLDFNSSNGANNCNNNNNINNNNNNNITLNDDKGNDNETTNNNVNVSADTNRDHHHTDNDDDDDLKETNHIKIEETPENLAIKENILQALGLQSWKAAEEAKLKNKEKLFTKNDNYTGTLKTVIKLNRDNNKKRRNTIKMTLHKKSKGIDCDGNISIGGMINEHHGLNENRYKIMKENFQIGDPSSSSTATTSNWKLSGQSSDTAGAHRKSHYSNRSNMDGSSEHTSDGEVENQEGGGTTLTLVIPEKASSFSIHPGRLCKDECSYCFGKFGLFDTPCHIAQMKNVEKQDKILGAEKHLTRDSCLCDACYRHVDRKSNAPSYVNKSYKRSALVVPGPKQDHCHVLGCIKVASNILRRKWIIKMRKSICQVINIDLDNPGLHSIPVCDEHYSALEHLMVCAMCKRRLARNHVHYLGPETIHLNVALNNEGIPLTLTDKPVVCKLCKCFATIILKPIHERPENSYNFFMEYKKRLLHFNDIVPMDEAAAEEPIIVPSSTKEKTDKEQLRKRKRISKHQQLDNSNNNSHNHNDNIGNDSELINDHEKFDQNRVPSSDSTSQSRPESPTDYMIDYNTLIPSIAMECGSDSEIKKNSIKKSISLKKIPRPESVKQAVEISKKLKSDKNSDIAVQRLGSNPSISVRQLFPFEEDLPLHGNVEFGNIKERTPEGWEKCCSVIQYDMETKQLWQELQKPYGNQSSFLRHLILLEKYFRNGDLILSPTASHHSINYSESVQNRLRAYDNIAMYPNLSLLPFSNNNNNKTQKNNSGIMTSSNVSPIVSTLTTTLNAANLPKNTPITLSQLNSPPLIPNTVAISPSSLLTNTNNKPKTVGAPPGLISLQPGTNRPVAPLVKVPQSQKIKFPITKNWRPNLIPIDPNKKTTERKFGLVQVISGGKPYHITLEDYKKMCAIKKSFELKQKKLQETKLLSNSKLKSLGPRKGLVISKTTQSITSPKQNEHQTTLLVQQQQQSQLVGESENILEKLDKQVEKLELKLNENCNNTNNTSINKQHHPQQQQQQHQSLNLPKIPKSLTVIPQTVTRKPSRPSSPILLITQKPKQTITNKS